MRRLIILSFVIFCLSHLTACATSSLWSTMYNGNNMRIIEFDNSKRYIHIREIKEKTKEGEKVTAINSCLENVGPSTKDEFYKLALANPSGQTLNGGAGTKASNIYNVGEIMQFGNTILYRLCESYLNGFYDHYGTAKDIKYSRDFNEAIRKIALLVAVHSSETADKEKMTAIINALDRWNEIVSDIARIKIIISQLDSSNEKDKKEITTLNIILKELDETKENIAKLTQEVKLIKCAEDCEKEKKTEKPKDPETPRSEKQTPPSSLYYYHHFFLDSIYFEYNKFQLMPEAKDALTGIVSFINSNPSLQLSIIGHADTTGTAERNKILSCERAKEVSDFIEKNRQKIEGKKNNLVYGCGASKQFLVYNGDKKKELKEISRRVEFIFSNSESYPFKDLVKDCKCPDSSSKSG